MNDPTFAETFGALSSTGLGTRTLAADSPTRVISIAVTIGEHRYSARHDLFQGATTYVVSHGESDRLELKAGADGIGRVRAAA